MMKMIYKDDRSIVSNQRNLNQLNGTVLIKVLNNCRAKAFMILIGTSVASCDTDYGHRGVS